MSRRFNRFFLLKGQIIDQYNNSNPSILYLLNSSVFDVQLKKGGFSYDLYKISNNDQRFLKSEFSTSRVPGPASRVHPVSRSISQIGNYDC